jgi:hypothetical protein
MRRAVNEYRYYFPYLYTHTDPRWRRELKHRIHIIACNVQNNRPFLSRLQHGWIGARIRICCPFTCHSCFQCWIVVQGYGIKIKVCHIVCDVRMMCCKRPGMSHGGPFAICQQQNLKMSLTLPSVKHHHDVAAFHCGASCAFPRTRAVIGVGGNGAIIRKDSGSMKLRKFVILDVRGLVIGN